MADRKQLIQANQAREPSPTKIYRRNQIAPTLVAGPRADVNAGKSLNELASFLGNLTPTLGKVLADKKAEQEQSQRAQGIASVKRATPEQLKKFATAIKNGTISEGQSPYFREGVDIAYSELLTSRYNEDLFEEYERSGVKNDESSGALEEFMQNFDIKFQETHFGQINPEILQDHFYPQAQNVRRQLSQRHTEYQNSVYRDRSHATFAATVDTYVNENASNISKDLDANVLNSNETGVDPYVSIRQGAKEQAIRNDIAMLNLKFARELQEKINKNPNYKLTEGDKEVLKRSPEGIALLNAIEGN